MLLPTCGIAALLRRPAKNWRLSRPPGQRGQQHRFLRDEIGSVTGGRRIVHLEKSSIGFCRLVQYNFTQRKTIFCAENSKKELWTNLIKAVSHEAVSGRDSQKMPAWSQQLEAVLQGGWIVEDVFEGSTVIYEREPPA